MKKQTISLHGTKIRVENYRVVIVGSGAAGLNCAVHLAEMGVSEVAVVTEKLGGGASFNSGSDKQTYLKPAMTGPRGDSVDVMARDLFSGGAMHGDHALAEAAGSLSEFFHLAALGVDFPRDEWGAFPGYRTDHDSRGRGTSAGPLTSRFMCERLLEEAIRLGVPIIRNFRVLKILTSPKSGKKRVRGALALNLKEAKKGRIEFVFFACDNLVYAVGGPGGLYERSVYPPDQNGTIWPALEAGARGANLTESQFGIASVKFRWNLSGSYQQVVPRYFSALPDGSRERNFLDDYFPTKKSMRRAIFLKGYQWPFDPRKIERNGSSMVDLLVHREFQSGRRVYMDFRSNAGGKKFDASEMEREARDYLEKAGATGRRPIDRLRKLNPAAIELFRSHGIDLAGEPLEIAVCAQHNNGGLAVDAWWETDLSGLFAVGEAAGTHGIYRPGGAALNSGQVGGLRAARRITSRGASKKTSLPAALRKDLEETVLDILSLSRGENGSSYSPNIAIREIRRRMTSYAGHVRSEKGVETALLEACEQAKKMEIMKAGKLRRLPVLLKARELFYAHLAYIEAVRDYVDRRGPSQGSCLIMKSNSAGDPLVPGSYRMPARRLADEVQEIEYRGGGFKVSWKPVRPVPKTSASFEKVWEEHRKRNAGN